MQRVTKHSRPSSEYQRKARETQDTGRDSVSVSANPSSSVRRLSDSAAYGDKLTPKKMGADYSTASEQKRIGADRPLTPRPRADRHPGTMDGPEEGAGTAMTAKAQRILNRPPVILSSAHLTPAEGAKWVAHQRVLLKAGTFADNDHQ